MRGDVISASGVATVLRDGRARPQKTEAPIPGSQETTEAAHPRLDIRGSRREGQQAAQDNSHITEAQHAARPGPQE